MRKALLYLFFLGMLFFNMGQAYALTSPGVTTENGVSHKIQKETVIGSDISEKITLIYKTDFINDYDESDESDCDDQAASLKDKAFFTFVPFLLSIPSTADFSNKPFSNKIYYHVNFSRLPRFNYISLRVLRL